MTSRKPVPPSGKTSHFCALLGGGGHARMLIDCLRAGSSAVPYVVLDSDQSLWGKEILGVQIVGGDTLLRELQSSGPVDCFAVAVGSVGDSRLRVKLFEFGLSCGVPPLTIIHPTAILSPFAHLGAGCQVLPGAIINAGARLGRNVIVNTGAVIEHDCVAGDHCHISTGALLAGGVTIGASSHIGIGAAVRQGIRIGENAIVGAGAVVVSDVPDNVVVAGVPARPLQFK